MAGEFNPYQTWLGLSPADLPLDYYRLLGLSQFETDPAAIEQAANRQAEKLQPHLTGPAAKVAERVAAEVAAARSVLSSTEKRGQYDTKLKAKLAAAKSGNAAATAPPATSASAPARKIPVAKPLPAAPTTTAVSPSSTVPPPPEEPASAPLSFAVSPKGETQRKTSSKSKKGSNTLLFVVLGGVVGIAAVVIAGVVFFANSAAKNNGANVAQANANANKPLPPAPPPAKPATKPEPSETPEPTIPPQPDPQPAEVSPPVTAPAVNPPVTETVAPTVNPPAVIPVTEPPPTVPAVAPPMPAPQQPVANPPAETAGPVDTRLPIPNVVERAAAEKEIRDVFANSLAAAKTADEKLAAAKELIVQANDPNNSAAVRYAAWQLARNLTLEAGQLDEALAVLDSIGKVFAVSVTAEKVAVLNESAEAAGAASRAKALAAARREFQSLLQAEAYADAVEMGRAALNLAKAARDKAAIDQITAAAIELKGRQQAHTEYLAAVERLKINSGDPAANLVAGRWLWFNKSDLAEGLQHLSLASDANLAAAATADLAEPTDHKPRVALADQWRALAELEKYQARETILKRAKHWYQLAIATAAGLEKVRLEKALAEINRDLPGGNPAQVAANDHSSLADVLVKPPMPTTPAVEDKPAAEWKIPKANANTAFKSFLGVYMYQEDRNKIYPVVNLKIPNRNLWSQEVQDKCRGRISFDEISYQGTASFVIPADGIYVLTMEDGKASINGKPTGGAGELSMVKGIHTFSYSVGSHGQPHINKANISLRHKETGAEVVFFNAWRDIQAFLVAPIRGQRALDVSDWKPTEADEIRVDTKTLQVTNPNRQTR